MPKCATLSKEDLIAALNFAKETYTSHKSHLRPDKKIIEHILIGKLGEIGFFKIFNIATEINPKKTADFGFDCILHNAKVDIKTLDSPDKKRVYINDNCLNADIYALMYLDRKTNIVVYLGALSKKEVQDKIKYDKKKLSYIDKEDIVDKNLDIFENKS